MRLSMVTTFRSLAKRKAGNDTRGGRGQPEKVCPVPRLPPVVLGRAPAQAGIESGETQRRTEHGPPPTQCAARDRPGAGTRRGSSRPRRLAVLAKARALEVRRGPDRGLYSPDGPPHPTTTSRRPRGAAQSP